MDRAMVVEGRNLAWREKGGSQWGRRREASLKSSEGFNRGTNWVRSNNFNSYFELPHHQNPRRTKSLIPPDSQLLAHLAQSIILVGSQMNNGLNANTRVYATSVGRSGTHPTRVDTAINTWW